MTGLEVFCSIKVKVFPFEMEITEQSSFLGLCSTATVTTNTRFDVHEQKPEAPEQRVGSRKPLVKIYLLLRPIKKVQGFVYEHNTRDFLLWYLQTITNFSSQIFCQFDKKQ